MSYYPGQPDYGASDPDSISCATTPHRLSAMPGYLENGASSQRALVYRANATDPAPYDSGTSHTQHAQDIRPQHYPRPLPSHPLASSAQIGSGLTSQGARAPYNPQMYHIAQASVAPPRTPSSLLHDPPMPSSPTYQSYNPAAYQQADRTRQSTIHSQTFQPYQPQTYRVPPPLPARPFSGFHISSPLPEPPGQAYLPTLPSSTPPRRASGASRDNDVDFARPPYSTYPSDIASSHLPYKAILPNDIESTPSYQNAIPATSSPGIGPLSYGSSSTSPLASPVPSGYSDMTPDRTKSTTYQRSSLGGQSTASMRQKDGHSSITCSPANSGEGHDRHPQARPLPTVPLDYSEKTDNGFKCDDIYHDESFSSYDTLMNEVEAAVMGRPLPSRKVPHVSGHNNDHGHGYVTGTESHSSHRSNSFSSDRYMVDQMNGYDYDRHNHPSENESDAEADAGLAAMRSAEEQDAAQAARTRSSRNTQLSGTATPARHDSISSSNSGLNIDMSSYGGGFPGNFHYGGTPLHSTNSGEDTLAQDTRPHSSSARRSHLLGLEYYQPLPPARVDTGETGGLAEPGKFLRRTSYDDGDDQTTVDYLSTNLISGSSSPSRDSIPDMFFHPPVSGRALPPTPTFQTVRPSVAQSQPPDHDIRHHESYIDPTFPRSTSLVSRSSQTYAPQPLRSKTDAEKLPRQHTYLTVRRSGSGASHETGNESAPSLDEVGLGLPLIPMGKRRKFVASKLSDADFALCTEPWALSAIYDWIKSISDGDADLKEASLVEGIVALFTHKVPTMNTAHAEVLGEKVVHDMLSRKCLTRDEEWVKFGDQSISGVLFQLTGTGCYSSRGHAYMSSGKCYSYHCMRTLKKINLHDQSLQAQRPIEDWVTFYKLGKENLEGVEKKEIERQNILHEIVTTEDNFMEQLMVLQILYRDGLLGSQPPILSAKRSEQFLTDVFGRIDAIKKVNEEYLLAQLKYRQQEQGPWIVGFSSIFREWVRKAKHIYVAYAANFPRASLLVRQEADRNILFRQFLDQVRENASSKRLGWDTYLKAPITRLQRYSLLLSTVHRHMVKDSEEKSDLTIAINEIKTVTMECDARVAEVSKSVLLSELANRLKLRPGMEQVQLNLNHTGREIIYRGDVQRSGTAKFSWVDSHAILFDHYFLLAKVIEGRQASGSSGRSDYYDVSKLPIPMDLLVLESSNEDPVVKSSMKGLGSVTSISGRGPLTDPLPSGMSTGVANSPPFTHTDSATSTASLRSGNSSKTLNVGLSIESTSIKDEKIMYPFRIRHLGRNQVYVLYAPSKRNRQDWCDKILEAQTRHAASLFKQNAEPFRLRVIADTAFAYDMVTTADRRIPVRGTPLDRAIQEIEKLYTGEASSLSSASAPRPNAICRAAVNCASSFTHPNGKRMMAVGTDFGVYIAEEENPRGWTRAIAAARVTQLSVLEEFSLFVILSDKVLIAHHLDVVLAHGANDGALAASASSDTSSRKAPQRLSGTHSVGFFAQGRMKDRQLIMYKKREGISSVFKVIEPVYQKSVGNPGGSSVRARLGGMVGRKGSTEFFRDFDEFYVASESYAINLFHSSLAISTAKGIEVMTLDKKIAFTIPDLESPAVASVATRLHDQKPLGMFRLSESEFLLVYEEVAVYVNKHGDVSRSVVMGYIGRARQACLVDSLYLILVDAGGTYVEVRNAINGRLKQIISGRDVRLLDVGAASGSSQGNSPILDQSMVKSMTGTVKICMQHPERERSQIILELLVNQGLKE